MLKMLPVLFLTILSQFTVSSESWIVASATDVSKVETTLTNWIQSFFNLISDFSGVIIALLVFFILLRLLRLKRN